LRKIRGAEVGMVFQDPLTSLDPVIRVVDQVAEVLVVHGAGRREARDQARAVLDRLGVLARLPGGDGYPHQLSGGMRQRVGIAMAVVARPRLLLADEPTTALDVRVQAQVLALLDDLTRERGTAVLLITHDLGIVAGFADRVAVMRNGVLVETADVDTLFAKPSSDYTAHLLAAVPRIDAVLPDESGGRA
jgi:ABC-type dipeptide/oligopeptide/nickel transport system ATPase component